MLLVTDKPSYSILNMKEKQQNYLIDPNPREMKNTAGSLSHLFHTFRQRRGKLKINSKSEMPFQQKPQTMSIENDITRLQEVCTKKLVNELPLAASTP